MFQIGVQGAEGSQFQDESLDNNSNKWVICFATVNRMSSITKGSVQRPTSGTIFGWRKLSKMANSCLAVQ